MTINDFIFRQKLSWGQTGETVIARWLRSIGYDILPVYEKVIDTGKGPRVFTAYQNKQKEIVAPDMLAFRGAHIRWVEGKRKAHFTWRWVEGVWQDGIDTRHFEHYCYLRERSTFPLWILFFHDQSQPSAYDLKHGCPDVSPTGLYGNEIRHLKVTESHRDKYCRDGRNYPMVYWNIEHLKPIATLDQVLAAQNL